MNENFTIIVLPDTQGYTQIYPWLFDNQTQWIVDNAEELNIVFVTHLGDLVDSYGNITQWEYANSSMSKLDDNVRWAVLPGNHDGYYGEPNDLANYNNYFGYERFSGKSWYGGTYKTGDNTNSYQLFSAGGDDYLILHLQYDPSDTILAWANNVIENYPTRRVIISTHDYINWWWMSNFRSNIGEKIWQKLVKPHADQIFLVLCGHVDVEDHRTETVNEHAVHQVVTDYQESPNGGNGWLKILEFSPLQDKIFVKTYSPYLGELRSDPNSMFTLDYDMTSTEANITVLSNSTLSDFAFDRSHNQINFTISGETGTTGYCNVTIQVPHLGNPWNVQIDESYWSYNYYSNATHTSLYFKYSHPDTLQVTIMGTRRMLIAEFAPEIVLPMFIIATLLAIIISKRKMRTYNSKTG